jgi:transposase
MMALFDLTSTWVEGSHCELAAFGYSRDKKRGRRQVEFAVLAAPDGTPVAVRAFKGNTDDATACLTGIKAVAEDLGMERAVLVGGRGSVTSTRIADLKEAGLGWVGALKRAQIKALAEDDGPLQMSLFDARDFAEIASEDYPGERLIACWNPHTAERRAQKRERLVAATVEDLDKIGARVAAGRLKSEKAIGLAVGKIINKHNVGRFCQVQIGPGVIKYGCDQPAIKQDALLDGVYVIRTSLPAAQMGAADTVRAYKALSKVEQDFASIKGFDIEARPIWHRLAGRVEAHLLICLLASYLAFHLRKAWAPITFADEHPDALPDPVKPRHRSASAQKKASTRRLPDGQPARSFRGVLDQLALIQRANITITAGHHAETTTVTATPDAFQAEALRLIGAPIPDQFPPSQRP